MRCIRCGKPIDDGGDLCAPCAPLYWSELETRIKSWPEMPPEPECEQPKELLRASQYHESIQTSLFILDP